MLSDIESTDRDRRTSDEEDSHSNVTYLTSSNDSSGINTPIKKSKFKKPLERTKSLDRSRSNFSEEDRREVKIRKNAATTYKGNWELLSGQWWINDNTLPVYKQRKMSETVKGAIKTIRSQANAIGMSHGEVKVLKQQIGQLNLEIKTKQDDEESKNEEINYWKEKASRYRDERDKLRKENKHIERYRDERNMTKNKLNDLQNDYEKSKNESKNQKTEIKNLKIDKKSMSVELNEKDKEIEDLKRRLEDDHGLKDRYERTLNELKTYKKNFYQPDPGFQRGKFFYDNRNYIDRRGVDEERKYVGLRKKVSSKNTIESSSKSSKNSKRRNSVTRSSSKRHNEDESSLPKISKISMDQQTKDSDFEEQSTTYERTDKFRSERSKVKIHRIK